MASLCSMYGDKLTHYAISMQKCIYRMKENKSEMKIRPIFEKMRAQNWRVHTIELSLYMSVNE